MVAGTAILLSACGGGAGNNNNGSPSVPPAPPPIVHTPGSITLFAGSQTGGLMDGAALEVRFSSIYGLTVGDDGTLYVADKTVVRKIAPNGQVSTLAGQQVPGFDGPIDGQGAAARFCSLAGLAVDSNANVYAVDRGISVDVAVFGYSCVSNFVRKIDSSGVVSAFAGQKNWVANPIDGPVTNVQFSEPFSIARDGAGNFYVLDRQNIGGTPFTGGYIRKITPTGQVSTPVKGILGVLDTNPAFRTTPFALTADPSGNVYYSNDAAISKVSPDGAITVLAGVAGSYGVVDGAGTAARFTNPGSMTVDAAGNLYVLDRLNETGGQIRMITPAGVVSTVPVSLGSYFMPFALTCDNKGNLYLSARGGDSDVILKIELPT